jgi:hypothetical protein
MYRVGFCRLFSLRAKLCQRLDRRLRTIHACDADSEPVRQLFSDSELGNLSVVIVLLSCFNRLAIGLRTSLARDE